MLSFPGLYKWRLTAKMLYDVTADASLFPLVGNTTAKNVVVRLTSAAKGASNPEWTGTGYLLKYPFLAGAVGDLQEFDIEIGAASALARGV
jgi:hypothetical protein